MIDVVRLWERIKGFVDQLDGLEKGVEDTKDDVKHIEREMALARREAEHDRHVNKEVQKHLLQELTKLEARLKKVESEKHGALVKAGRANAENKRLKEERTGPKDPKKRH